MQPWSRLTTQVADVLRPTLPTVVQATVVEIARGVEVNVIGSVA